MVIAALVSFVLLLLAWLLAPERHAAELDPNLTDPRA